MLAKTSVLLKSIPCLVSVECSSFACRCFFSLVSLMCAEIFVETLRPIWLVYILPQEQAIVCLNARVFSQELSNLLYLKWDAVLLNNF